MAELDDILGIVLDEKYRVERLLGKGGMGAVYLATHLGTERPVAVKLMAPRLTQNDEFVRRFSREAKAAGRLRHPNVVDVTDFGIARTERGPLAYLVMEYLDGCTLADILTEEKRLPLEWASDIIGQTASAVQEAHQLGIVHRDLKPDNIWLEPNRLGGYRVKVLDFGLAKLAEVAPRAGTDESRQAVSGRNSLPDALTMLTDDNAPTLDANAITLEENAPTLEQPLTIHPATDTGALKAATKAFGAAAAGAADLEAATMALPAAPNTPDDEAATLALPAPADDEDAATQELSAAAVALQVASLLEHRPSPFATRQQSSEAHNTALDGNVTRIGSIIGTPLYMSPEQCRGEKLGVETDIYSLGVITYQMLAGETPFSGNSLEILRQHRSATPAPLREKNKKVPRKIARLVMSALEKDPAQRPPGIEAFADMFRANAEGVGTLLQRAMAIFSERFASLVKISLLVHLPLFLITGLMFLADGLVKWGYVGDTGETALGVTLSIASFIGNFVAASLISGVTILLVLQLSVAPLRPIQGREALTKVFGRLKPLLWTGLLIFIFAGLALAVILGGGIPLSILLKAKVSNTLGKIVGVLVALAAFLSFVIIMVRCSLHAPVVLVEGLSGRAALRRSSRLVSLALGTVLAITAVQWLIPITMSASVQFIVGSFSNNDNANFDNGTVRIEGGAPQPKVADESQTPAPDEAKKAQRRKRAYRAQVAGRFAGWLNVILVPLLSIINALLYLKLRQIAGESPKALMDSFADAEMPASRWQQRMRERVAYSTTSYRNTSKPPSSGSSPV